MKKALTLLSLSLFLILNLSAQEIIWGGPDDPNSTFDGGLNDWTAVGVSSAVPDSAANALWEWTADGALSDGAYWGGGQPIESPSVANGAAGFNSDRLDNDGEAGNFAMGPCPAPHVGDLISPIMDCSGYNEVFLKFHQSFRNFQTTPSVSISNDGGMTYDTTIVLNEGYFANESTEDLNIQVIDISSVAANSDNVRIKFTFDGNYYFWIIDDVQLITRPDHDLRLESFFYPASAFAQPASQIAADSFGFSCTIDNLSGQVSNNVTVDVSVVRASNGNEVYSDAVVLDQLPAGLDTFVVFDNLFAPELSNGDYIIRYSLSADETDYNPTDNVHRDSRGLFRVTSSLFSMDAATNNGGSTGYRPNGNPDYIIGNVYRMSPTSMETYQAVQATFQATGGTPGLAGKSVNVWFMEVSEDVDAGFNNFETETDQPLTANGSLNLLGGETYDFANNDPNFGFFDVNIVDFDSGETGVQLKPGGRYFLVAEYLGDNNLIFHCFDERRSFNFISTVLYDFGDQTWFLGGFGPSVSAVMRMEIELVTDVDEVPLNEDAFQVFPNPTASFVQAQVDFDQPTRATITLADQNGRVLNIDEQEGLTNELLNYDVSNYPNGLYILRIATEQGTKTHRFTVQR
jgi:hypothetical protein